MNPDKVPQSLRSYITLVDQWSVADDADREDLIHGASVEELRAMVVRVDEIDDAALDDWLAGPESFSDEPSEEYIKFTDFIAAYDLAKLRLERSTD